MDAGRTAGKNNTDGLAGQDIRQGHVPRNDFGIDVAFADTAGDQLGILAAKVQDNDGFFLLHRFPPKRLDRIVIHNDESELL